MKERQAVRVRFAPSPTGYVHIGNFRTALFNYLFARSHEGAFLLRIEDTDVIRSKKIFADALIKTLSWADIAYDEDIVYQSDRIVAHKQAIQQLLDNGHAYRCYCLTGKVASKAEYIKYDGRCRIASSVDVERPYVVRIKLPIEEKTISFRDLIRGTVTFGLDEFDDFIIARSDGTPVYNLAVVVDDAFMGITHIIRGEDHISNTPKQLVLYRALGFSEPFFAHLPLILGSDGQRLSKRDAVSGVDEYRKLGYVSDAFVNYVLRLGWAHHDQEIFSRQEMIALFSLQGVGKSSAMFDKTKLDWLNSVYMRNMSAQQILDIIEVDIDPDFIRRCGKGWTQQQIISLIALYTLRHHTIKEVADEICALCIYEGDVAHQVLAQVGSVSLIEDMIEQLSSIEPFDRVTIEQEMKRFCAEKKIGLKVVGTSIRVALTGTLHSPGIFDLLAVCGKKIVQDRLGRLLHTVQQK